MTLREYISAGHSTITQIGYQVGVSEHGVRKWVYGQRQPDLHTALRIVDVTNGKVTMEELVKPKAAA